MGTKQNSKEINKIQPNELDDDIYIKSKIPFYKIIVITFILIILGFIIHFPFAGNIKKTIINNLSASACPIYIKDIDFKIFPPRIILEQPVIAKQCLPNSSSNITLKDINLFILFPNIYPIGLKFKLEIDDFDSKINTYFILSPFKQIIKIADTRLNTLIFNKFMNGKKFVSGNFDIKGLAEIKNNNIHTANFSLQSKDVSLLKQNLSGLIIPQLPINVLYLEGTYQQNIVNIKSLVLGNESSPIIAKASGDININEFNLMNSTLKIKGQTKFSNEFINLFPILNLLLSSKHSDNGFYNFEVKGNLAKPQPKLL